MNIAGIEVRVDPDIPDGEIRFVDVNGKIVGKIINIGSDAQEEPLDFSLH
jgi:hypothetical protein